mmetsp:Transcript_576/g.1007  ORF Transcript_576/g.1007 Transcript_576/m.1007 type:complete len:252 (+) Transcript_576:240-995(+)|eukprot:CAMPEP_0174992182 /NCGR_PEP_ID=MMETSP0004_2-20121128/22372_1 /TAXON_ID=420556 /ORGANISM="Ochromonas sp., Strain CCMP1393" /LENGTH=251 /DNA_ID=CAMNT_0016246147 /DNA_START=221 /DNA_END=976 /DNA_ORIENTATION=-
MAEVTRSPDLFLGKRRSGREEEYDTDMTTVNESSSVSRSTKKLRVNHRSSPHLSSSISVSSSKNVPVVKFADFPRHNNSDPDKVFKKLRTIGAENFESPEALGKGSSESSSGKMPTISAVNQEMQRYHESVVASLKMEQQMAVERKDQEIRHLTQQNQQLMGQYQSLAQQHETIHEENRVLKRGIQIQDGKHRELGQQYQRLQEVMSMAAARIAQLEQQNRQLTEQLYTSSAYSGSHMDSMFPPPGPPDIY